MNAPLRLLFLPIMLAAGVLTVILMVALTAPVAMRHIFRDRRLRQQDLPRVRAWRENFRRACSLNGEKRR